MKYSDVLMLSMNDTITLGQRVDVRKALNLRTMFKETGKERIDVRTILNEDAPVFPYVWEKIAPKIEVLPLVAYNSAFDIG